MCGIIGYVGEIDDELLARLEHESKVRGLHTFYGYYSKRIGIAHCRYSTSGEDPQPIQMDDGLIFCFNGVIDMRTKKEMEKAWGIKMATDNDGEIILQLAKTPQQSLEFLKHNPCSFAGLWQYGGTLVAIRNAHRPLWCWDDGKVVILVSTADILKRSGLSLQHAYLLNPLEIYKWKK